MRTEVTEAVNYPARNALLGRLARANSLGWFWLFLQIAICLVLMLVIDWNKVLSSWIIPSVAAAVMIGPTFMSFLTLWAQRKVAIRDLRPDTKFGIYDKFMLQRLFQETLQRLKLPDDHVPVYITADKSLNAAALSPGLLDMFLKSLHGVYLHRQMLHKLEPEEIQDILGHELGHYYRYYLVSDRFRSVTLFMGALLGVLIADKFDLEDTLGFLALLVAGWGIPWIASLPRARLGTAIEYLCDDFGARVQGVETSIQSLLKFGADDEVQWAIQHEVLFRNPTAKHLGVVDTIAAVQAAIPFGTVSRDELEKAVEKQLRKKRKEQTEFNFGRFLQFAWQGDDPHDEEALAEGKAKAKALERVPRLKWESLLPRGDRIELDGNTGKLVAMIESQPDHVLFRHPSDVWDPKGTHPPIRSRILYLWHHRAAIEGDNRQ